MGVAAGELRRGFQTMATSSGQAPATHNNLALPMDFGRHKQGGLCTSALTCGRKGPTKGMLGPHLARPPTPRSVSDALRLTRRPGSSPAVHTVVCHRAPPHPMTEAPPPAAAAAAQSLPHNGKSDVNLKCFRQCCQTIYAASKMRRATHPPRTAPPPAVTSRRQSIVARCAVAQPGPRRYRRRQSVPLPQLWPKVPPRLRTTLNAQVCRAWCTARSRFPRPTFHRGKAMQARAPGKLTIDCLWSHPLDRFRMLEGVTGWRTRLRSWRVMGTMWRWRATVAAVQRSAPPHQSNPETRPPPVAPVAGQAACGES